MKPNLQKLSFLIIGIFIAVGTSYLNAWTGPTQTAPNGNVDAPVNLSALSQVKLGGLSVASLLSTGAVGASQYCDALGQNCVTPPLSGGGGSVPAGSIQAFNLTTCPTGWIPADGTNGTPDLRGYFIRGYGTNSDGTASAAFGIKQLDELKSHRHYIGSMRSQNIGGGGSNNIWDVDSGATYTSYEGGDETRPKNIALLYCQKDGTSTSSGTTTSSILAKDQNLTNVQDHTYTVNLTDTGVLVFSNSYCGAYAAPYSALDAKLYVNSELVAYDRGTHPCTSGYCGIYTSATVTKTLSPGTYTLKSSCEGSGRDTHKSNYVIFKF